MGSNAIRVALVTDDAALEDSIRRDLSESVVVLTRLHGSPATEGFAQELDLSSCDLCLLDREGHGWDGFDVLREVSKGKSDAPPIVLLGSDGNRDEDLEAMSLGAAAYVPKPGLTAELLERTIRYAAQCGRRSHMLAQELASVAAARGALASLMDAAPVLVARIDREGRCEYVNAIYSEWMDTPRDDVIGNPVQDTIPASMWEAVRGHMDSALASNTETFELTIPSRGPRTLNGQRYVSVACTPQRDDDGNLDGFVVGATDITARKEMETSLRKLSSVLDQIEDMVVITDPNGVIEYTNPAFVRQTGYSRADTIGNTPRLQKSGRHDAEFYKRLWDTLLAGETFQAEFTNQHKDGSLYREEKVITPIRDDAGIITHFASTGRDITERKEFERRLAETNRHLEEALEELREQQQRSTQQERLRALGQMASGVAHDLNNALSPIVGFSDLLRLNPDIDADKAARYLDMISTAARSAQETVLRLREFYRPRDEQELIPIDLPQIVAEVISLTQPRWKDESLARGTPIHLHTDLRDTPKVLGNDAQIRDALTNLILNVCDAMPDGGKITISLSTAPARANEEQNERVVLEVRDTGMGMPDDVRSRCFEPFFTTKGVRGTGMGLAMVYGTMQRHDGQIEIDSEEGQGTTIRLFFPVPTTQATTQEPENSHAEPVDSLRVLVVDDDPLMQELVSECLLGDGHVVSKADNGLEGMILARQEDFDLIITDRAMPEMSGDQFSERLRVEGIATPVIMLTGYGAMMDMVPEGVTTLVAKPATISKLRDAIARTVGPAAMAEVEIEERRI